MVKKVKKVPFAKLKGLRAERGLSMDDMAKILGVALCTYVAKENAKRDFTFTEMSILRDYFKISSEELFFTK